MIPRALHILFGLAIGVLARLLLPGHPVIGIAATIMLSFAGSLSGALAAEKFLTDDNSRGIGYFASALGALALLLFSSILH